MPKDALDRLRNGVDFCGKFDHNRTGHSEFHLQSDETRAKSPKGRVSKCKNITGPCPPRGFVGSHTIRGANTWPVTFFVG